MQVILGTGTASATAALTVGNIIGRMYNALLVADSQTALIVAIAVAAGVLLCCLCACIVGYCCRGCGKKQGAIE